jgi:lactoylglutathione lyase
VKDMKCNCANGCGETLGLAHIGVFTTDIEKSIRFYTELLGFENYHSAQLGGTKLAFIKTGSCIIELVQPEDTTAIATRTNGIVDHVAIAVKDISKLVCRLFDEGIEFESDDVMSLPGLFDGAKAIFFKGPNGERLELFEITK